MEVIHISTFLYILLAIFIFGALVFIHEFGHFIAARLFKIRVNEFALGMGPILLKKQGEKTLYSLRLLPIGGFCAMDGEDGEGSESVSSEPYQDGESAFFTKPAWQRIIVLASGAIMNLLLGLLVLFVFYLPFEEIGTTTIDHFMDGFPANIELREGDEIIKINNNAIFYNWNIETFLEHDSGAPYDITIRRDGEIVMLYGVPLQRRGYDVEKISEDGSVSVENEQRYGLVFVKEIPTLDGKIRLAALNGADFVRMVWISIGDLFSGKAGVSEMSGPIGIGGMIVETAQQSMPTLWLLVALITINLGVMNLMPIPALDGGRILFILLDGLTFIVAKRRINPKYEGAIHMAGFALLMLLIVFVSFNDVMRFFKK